MSQNALMYFYGTTSDDTGWFLDLGRYNLLGDPVVDIGDRVKFSLCCDLIISPEDLEMARFPAAPMHHGSVKSSE